jgi:chemotaxis-related protein WspB
MLFLSFQIGNDRYLLESRSIVEILPTLDLKEMPQSPAGVAGLFNYLGSPLPLIDVSLLLLGRSSARHMSTRIVVVKYTEAAESRLFGLLLEKATTVVNRADKEFTSAGLSFNAAPYLGPIAVDQHGIHQQFMVRHLLSHSLCNQLFQPHGALM